MDADAVNKKRESLLAQVEARGFAARGKRDLSAFLKGGPVTSRQAIRAKCYECMAYYQDKELREDKDCKCVTCPLYPYNPYARHRPQWLEDIMRRRAETYKRRLALKAEDAAEDEDVLFEEAEETEDCAGEEAEE